METGLSVGLCGGSAPDTSYAHAGIHPRSQLRFLTQTGTHAYRARDSGVVVPRGEYHPPISGSSKLSYRTALYEITRGHDACKQYNYSKNFEGRRNKADRQTDGTQLLNSEQEIGDDTSGGVGVYDNLEGRRDGIEGAGSERHYA
ncbi:hypothetical protein BOTBODRAFT_48799 [Botryobasidium botryosum FD-172 SS1]|uniref:Uncharacterized protein n=1 Tax=Botryobasidium botryosum (strain FD-172 SS1) TaxID=930990 RepID=A0A067LW89_BOTB1|nr:hypothetical protein BOTBODRAFT_48799 [Botryobasidium botryosum FD-172 SS1]